MRKLLWPLCMVAVGCILATLSGCAPAEDLEQRAPAPSFIQLDRWPENEYTKHIPKPQDGEPDYAIFDALSGYYAIFLSDITRIEGERYIENLRQEGFIPRHIDAGEVNIGTILEKSGVYVGVSASDHGMGLYIAFS